MCPQCHVEIFIEDAQKEEKARLYKEDCELVKRELDDLLAEIDEHLTSKDKP